MPIVLRKKSKRVPSPPRPKRRRRRRTLLPKTCPSTLSQLFRHEAMRGVSKDSVIMKTQIVGNAKELLSTLEGFVMNNDDCCGVGASEFHDRVRCAWQEEGIACGVFCSWTEYPAVIEGLRDFSKTCAPEERVSAMRQDPFLLDILEASKSAKDPFVMMRGLLSILFVYWNDGNDLEKLFIKANVVADPNEKEEEDYTMLDIANMEEEVVSFVAEHPDDMEVFKKLLKDKHGDGVRFVDLVIAQVSAVVVPDICTVGRLRIEVHYDSVGCFLVLFFPVS